MAHTARCQVAMGHRSRGCGCAAPPPRVTATRGPLHAATATGGTGGPRSGTAADPGRPGGSATPHACAGGSNPTGARGTSRGRAVDVPQTEKLEPQPQVDLAVGLLNLKPAPYRPS